MSDESDFAFRGDRKYLQSATLFDDLVARRGDAARDIDLRFARRTDRQVRYLAQRPDEGESLVAEWHDEGGDVFVVEGNAPIERSEPYDEPSLVAGFRFAGRTVDVPADIGRFSRIEAIVAAFKHLLHRVYPDVARKYVFVRIRLAKLPEGALRIVYARDIGRFFQGDIVEGDRTVGQIFFGVW